MADSAHIEIEHVASGADKSLELALASAQARGSHPRLRVALQLWDGKQYQSWKNQIWKMDIAGADDARNIQGAIAALFDLLAFEGSAKTKRMIEQVFAQIMSEHEEETPHADHRP